MTDAALTLESVSEVRQKRPIAKWPRRQSFLFVIGASTGLWAIIVTAVAAVIP